MKAGILACILLAVSAAWAGDYSHYRGDGSGAPPDGNQTLVSKWSDARLLWSSGEPAPPLGRKATRDTVGVGGFGVPVVADGRVYVGYLRPAGPEVTYNGGAWEVTPGSPCQVDADEIVLCMDARTGKTLWRTVFERKGWNFCAVYPSDGQITPCVAGGKVFMQGSTGRAYCLDAQSGKTLWEQPTGKNALAWELYKKAVFEGKDEAKRSTVGQKYVEQVLAPRPPANREHGGSGGGGFNSTPTVFGDLAIFNAMGQETVAFEVQTGKERWRTRGTMGSSTCPVKWMRQGKEYLVAYPSGACIDPATGKTLWSIPNLGGGYQGNTPAISGDLLVATANNGGSRQDLRLFTACYRLSLKSAERVWKLPDGSGSTYMCPVIYRGNVYIHTGAKEEFAPEGYKGPEPTSEAIVCADLATGKIRGLACFATENAQGTGPFVMDGRLFVYGGHMYDPIPDRDGVLKKLDTLKPRSIRCTFPTGADGFLYMRPSDLSCLVQCWDLRAK